MSFPSQALPVEEDLPYVEVPNDIIDELLKSHLSGSQSSIALFLLTQGLDREKSSLEGTVEVIACATGYRKATILRSLRTLASKQIVRKIPNGNREKSAHYVFNMVVEDWKSTIGIITE